MLGLVHCNNVSGVSAFSSWRHKGTKEINEQSKEREKGEKKKKRPFLNIRLIPSPKKWSPKGNLRFEFTAVAFRVNRLTYFHLYWRNMVQSIGQASGATPLYVHALTICPLQAFDRQSPQQPHEGTWERQSLPRLHLANWQIQKSWFLTLQSNEIAGIWDRKRPQIQSLISIKHAAAWAVF